MRNAEEGAGVGEKDEEGEEEPEYCWFRFLRL